jgi:hypothetical protein
MGTHGSEPFQGIKDFLAFFSITIATTGRFDGSVEAIGYLFLSICQG